MGKGLTDKGLKMTRILKGKEERGNTILNLPEVMKASGYSKATIKRPEKVLRSENIQKAMEKHLSADFLMKLHRDTIRDTEDAWVTLKGLELAYKIKRILPGFDEQSPKNALLGPPSNVVYLSMSDNSQINLPNRAMPIIDVQNSAKSSEDSDSVVQ